ncbi:hypothetical protein [Halobacillus seohaensis]|uniref:Uncharacterized protein n=1 Tax=Halobacillus seohaensis TaxID=447421 RepID=A0ABW2EN68_9BACI
MLNRQINYHGETSAYDDMELDLLVGLYAAIHKNIQKGVLSERMYSELYLMQDSAKRRGISILPFDK